MSRVSDARVLSLRKVTRAEGSITPVESSIDVPFDVVRVYYLYDVPGGESRGSHAHKQLEQLIVSVMGSFSVVLDDGIDRMTFTLDRAYQGLYVPRLLWRELVGFSSGGVCVVLASLPYQADDYLRDYGEFLAYRERERSHP